MCKEQKKFAFFLFFARLFVPLAAAESTSARKKKKKIHFFSLFFARLFVPLAVAESTSARKKKKKIHFFLCSSLAYSYLCT